MIRRSADTERKENTNMRGGAGTVTVNNLLDKEKDEYYGKGRLFGKITIPVGASIGEHRHDGEMECFYIISGEGIFNDNGADTSVNAGDVCYTASGESHSIRNTGNTALELMALILYK